MIEVLTIETSGLGDRSYLVSDGSVAIAIDPQRDFDRFVEAAKSHGVKITHVFETHMHNDYVTGGLALCQATGATYHVNAADPVDFEHVAVSDGDVVEVSPAMKVSVLATPGHTYNHLSFAVNGDSGPVGVFTGGSLLYGSTGRPDLLGAEHTPKLVRAQYESVQRLARELPEQTPIYPTHGFGSFCSSTQTEGDSSTIAREKQINPALTLDQENFIEVTLAGLDDYPAYYAHMGSWNERGPAAPDLSQPEQADAAEVRRRIEAGEWVVDLRNRTAFAKGHVTGAVNFGLDGPFATYLGWCVPWGAPLTLLGDSPGQVAEAQRELVRIGYDRLEAAATGDMDALSDGPLSELPVASFGDLTKAAKERDIVVLDVRRRSEWNAAHIKGAVHIPLHELPVRASELPRGEVWVHCAGGYRASVAASLLKREGYDVTAVDDSFDNAQGAGAELEKQPSAA